jgi:hypothetical protein
VIQAVAVRSAIAPTRHQIEIGASTSPPVITTTRSAREPMQPNFSARPQDLSPRFAGAGSAISNVLLSGGFRYPDHGRHVEPLRFKEVLWWIGQECDLQEFSCRPDRPAIRTCHPSLN